MCGHEGLKVTTMEKAREVVTTANLAYKISHLS